jgi:transcriptional regulator with XRE-family HTH domain
MAVMAKQQQAPAEWLRAAAEAKGWNQTRLSEELGVHDSVISRWLNGSRVPSWPSAVKIEKLFNIPAKVWLKAAEDARRAAAQARKAG